MFYFKWILIFLYLGNYFELFNYKRILNHIKINFTLIKVMLKNLK